MRFSTKILGLLMLVLSSLNLKAQSLTYDSVPGDPLKARIYTLENGLKVYLSVYKDEPRFQSMIGVKAGSKNDPADHTGLAHYLEHMLFKGTDVYGTLDYTKEAPLLDTIFQLYERYGSTKDSLQRAKIYHQIDSVSGLAAMYAIPNEFDKMMAGMGVSSVNAYTSNEQTVYINNVPSNQLENFLTVEAERFRNPVFRLFHTELEAVYEEKNRGLDNDNSKIWENLYSGLFPNHQYGTQTTIGTIEHLKNPSLKAIRDYFNTYYVPNNMIIALSGDFDPDEAIRLINEKFGKMKPKEIPPFKVAAENYIKVPVVKEVWGPDAESVTIGFRFGGAATPDADLITVVDMILSNGQAGLLDLNLNKKQKVLSSSSSTDIMRDYSVHVLSGKPREGQSLQEVRDLLLGQIMEIKLGNFPDWIIDAVVTNIRLDQQRQFENNMRRASAMLNTELDGVNYKDQVARIERLSKINKQQVIDFVRTWYGDNYSIVFKKNGVDENVVKVVKPAITPVATNREAQSVFLKNILTAKVNPVQPEFVDFPSAISSGLLKGNLPLYRVRNTENDLFSLNYVFDIGFANDKKLPIAAQYLNFAGTDKKSAAEIQEEFYKLGCYFSANVSEEEFTISLGGLWTSYPAAVALLEHLLQNARPDEAALKNLVVDIEKKRANAKLNKNEILSRLTSYAKYGASSPATWMLSSEELKSLNGAVLLTSIKNLYGLKHRIDFYGPGDSSMVVSPILKSHKFYRSLKNAPAPAVFNEQTTEDGKVFFVSYDMKQAEVNFLSKGGLYDKSLQPIVTMYSRYFGGGMSSPVFQTLRESKALAYSVSSRYAVPSRPDRSYYNTAYIGTQADKLKEAMQGMMELLQTLPESEKTFENAKDGALQGLATDRITKTEILQLFHSLRGVGVDYDMRKDIYNDIKGMTLRNVEDFHAKYLKGKKYRIALIGNEEKIDFKVLGTYGEVVRLSVDQVFGY